MLDGELAGTQQVRQAFALLRIQHFVRLLQGDQHFLFETLGCLHSRAQRFGRRDLVEVVPFHRVGNAREAALS